MRSMTLDVHRRADTNFQTELDITNQHIALLASSAQLANLSTGNTLYSHMTALEVTADGLTTSVASKAGKSEIISVINQSAEDLTISGTKLSLNGYTSNPNFKVAVDGSVEITGKVTATSGNIAGFEINDQYLRKLSSITLDNNVSQTQYAVLVCAPTTVTPSEYAFRVATREYSGSGKNNASWTDTFKVLYDGSVYGSNINISGGAAGGFELGSNYIRKQPVSGTTIYEVSLYAPNNPPGGTSPTWPTTNAITVRYGTYDSSAVSHGRGWVDAFTVKYDGTVSSIAPTASSVTKECQIHNGRVKMYRNSTWLGELAQGVFSTTYGGTTYTGSAVFIQVGNDIGTGFGIGASSDGTGTQIFTYIPQLPYTWVDTSNTSHDVTGAWLCDRALFMQRQPIINAGAITSTAKMTATEFVTSSDKRLKENISEIQNGILKSVSEVKLKSFSFKKDKKQKLHFGAIAQDVSEALSSYYSDIVVKDESDPDGYLSLNYTEFLILRLAAAEKRIEDLERRLQ